MTWWNLKDNLFLWGWKCLLYKVSRFRIKSGTNRVRGKHAGVSARKCFKDKIPNAEKNLNLSNFQNYCIHKPKFYQI